MNDYRVVDPDYVPPPLDPDLQAKVEKLRRSMASRPTTRHGLRSSLLEGHFLTANTGTRTEQDRYMRSLAKYIALAVAVVILINLVVGAL